MVVLISRGHGLWSREATSEPAIRTGGKAVPSGSVSLTSAGSSPLNDTSLDQSARGPTFLNGAPLPPTMATALGPGYLK